MSRNFIRLLLLTEGFFIFAVVFLLDAYYVRPPVSSWGLTLTVITSVTSIALVIAIRVLPSFWRQTVTLRTRGRSMMAKRPLTVTIYAVVTGSWGAIGGYLLWNLTAPGVSYFSSFEHYLAVLIFVAIAVLLSSAYFNFLARS